MGHIPISKQLSKREQVIMHEFNLMKEHVKQDRPAAYGTWAAGMVKRMPFVHFDNELGVTYTHENGSEQDFWELISQQSTGRKLIVNV